MAPNQKVTDNGDGTVTVSGTCVFSKKPHSLTVSKKGFEAYKAGEYIQRALPEVPNEEREFLISGASPEGWKLVFGDGGEDE
jgi:hypothetical protein